MARFDKRSMAMAMMAVAIAALTAVLGIIFAQTQQTERVVAAATDLEQASNAFRLIESMDSRAEGALITVAAYNAGLTGQPERDEAIAAVAEAQAVIASTASDIFDGRLAQDLIEFIVLLESGDSDEARRHLNERVDPLVDTIRVQAGVQSQGAATVIEVETGVAANWGLATSFGVGLIAPLLALGVFKSFANRRRRQDHLEQQLARIEEVGQAKDDMIANLSHELRTPLTGIYGFALAMEDVGFDDPEFTAEMNSYIVRDAADLSRMVDDLLVVAKADNDGLHFSPEDLNPSRELDEALVAYKTSEKMITTDLKDAVVHVDRLRVRQIIRNLISNAEKHGGPNMTIRGRTVGNRYQLAIIDDGDGVSPEVSARLFDRFVHDGDAPLTKGSVGVGLSVAQALAAGMDCVVEHAQGADTTTFTIDMPLANPIAQPPMLPADLDSQSVGTPNQGGSRSQLPAPGPASNGRPKRRRKTNTPEPESAPIVLTRVSSSPTPQGPLPADPFA